MSKSVTPIDPVHPGEVLLEDFLSPLGLSANRLATHIQVPANRISAIVARSRGVAGDPEFWMNLQSHYNLEKARDELKDDLESISEVAA